MLEPHWSGGWIVKSNQGIVELFPLVRTYSTIYYIILVVLYYVGNNDSNAWLGRCIFLSMKRCSAAGAAEIAWKRCTILLLCCCLSAANKDALRIEKVERKIG